MPNVSLDKTGAFPPLMSTISSASTGVRVLQDVRRLVNRALLVQVRAWTAKSVSLSVRLDSDLNGRFKRVVYLDQVPPKGTLRLSDGRVSDSVGQIESEPERVRHELKIAELQRLASMHAAQAAAQIRVRSQQLRFFNACSVRRTTRHKSKLSLRKR